jgi:glycosyltransferase involved in cell wall biosynthesis
MAAVELTKEITPVPDTAAPAAAKPASAKPAADAKVEAPAEAPQNAAPRVCVLVPSHLRYDGQAARLERCIESLVAQTAKADIYLSISWAPNQRGAKVVAHLREKFGQCGLTIKTHDRQHFQLEHIETLMSDAAKYDLVMFCDDDDTYAPTRVALFANTFELSQRAEYKDSGVFALYEVDANIALDANSSAIGEYWRYGLPPHILQEFYTRMGRHKPLLNYRFCDVLLRMFLRTHTGTLCMLRAKATDGMHSTYNFTTDNRNSITNEIGDWISRLAAGDRFHPHQEFAWLTDMFIRLCIERSPTAMTILDRHKWDPTYVQMKRLADEITTGLFDSHPQYVSKENEGVYVLHGAHDAPHAAAAAPHTPPDPVAAAKRGAAKKAKLASAKKAKRVRHAANKAAAAVSAAAACPSAAAAALAPAPGP